MISSFLESQIRAEGNPFLSVSIAVLGNMHNQCGITSPPNNTVHK